MSSKKIVRALGKFAKSGYIINRERYLMLQKVADIVAQAIDKYDNNNQKIIIDQIMESAPKHGDAESSSEAG